MMDYSKHAINRLKERFSHHLVPNQHARVTMHQLFSKAKETRRFFNDSSYMVYVMDRYGDTNVKFFEYEDIIFLVREELVVTVYDLATQQSASSRYRKS